MQKLYSIAILLPDSIEELILQFKREIAQRFHSVAALKPNALITIQSPFFYDEKNLSELNDQLSSAFATASPFQVELQDFGAFPAHTIFAAISNFLPFQRLRDAIFRRLKGCPGFPAAALGSNRITPHVTIAQHDLERREFDEAWSEFCQREFSAQFTAAAAHLMELRGKWRSVHEFPFRGERRENHSLELFCA
ncbi:MAG: 2'-5' RNA ligase family protein [Leptospiraceae bacterium]|nr:2'-5' RNA ligase family protein [Leptospiraceae bacterium]